MSTEDQCSQYANNTLIPSVLVQYVCEPNPQFPYKSTMNIIQMKALVHNTTHVEAVQNS